MRRYAITFEDVFTRFGLALSTNFHVSLAAAELFKLYVQVFPCPIKFVLADNGLEFKKKFSEELSSLHLQRYYTYPHTPKMNSRCERFNRAVQWRASLASTKSSLWNDLVRFNELLAGRLLFHNLKRTHYVFDNKQTPIQFILSLPLQTLTAECKRGWPHTKLCKTLISMIL